MPFVLLSHWSGNRLGILMMLLSMSFFITNDVGVKLLALQIPVGQIMSVRGIFAAIFLIGVMRWLGLLAWHQFSQLHSAWVVVRCIGEAFATICYLQALALMPIANATAVLQISPMLMVGVMALFFGERVGIYRWGAIIIGLIGTLIVIAPGPSGFEEGALFAITALLGIVVRDVATRHMPKQINSWPVALMSTLLVVVCGFFVDDFERWAMPNANGWIILLVCAFLIAAAHYTLISAFRHGDVSAVAPFRYSIVLWSLVFGLFIWGDTFSWNLILGTIIVIAAGLFAIYRETRQV